MWNFFNEAPTALQLFCCSSSNLGPSVSMASQQHQSAVFMKVRLCTVSCSIISATHSGDVMRVKRVQRADKVERNEYRGAAISGWYERMGDSKKNIYQELEYTSSHKRSLWSIVCFILQLFSHVILFPPLVYSSIHQPAKWTSICVCVEWKRLKNKILKRIIENVLLLLCSVV